MAWATIPLNAADNYRAGDPITVLNPGTGRNERAQVEADWCVDYAGGVQRVVRVTYPAVWQPANQAQVVEVRASAAGLLEQFIFRSNVEQGLIDVGINFFAGPKATHFCVLKAPGAALPAPSYSGTRSRIYKWFARIYQPAHAPGLTTQLSMHFEVEVFHNEDYAEFRSVWGVCDPRLDEPNGYLRAALTDEETELGVDFIIPNQNVCQPVPWDPEQSVVSMAYIGADRWRWIQDKRLYYAGQIMNNVLPWGTAGRADGVLLFRTASGSLGDQLRDDSMAAWIAWPHPLMGISEQWPAKKSAYGGAGEIPRMFKRHEHFDMNRDRAYVRGRLEQQATTLVQSPPNGGQAYLWDRGPSSVTMYHQQYGSTATGTHGSWQKIPHWLAMAYRVPSAGVLAGRYIRSSFGGPHYFIETDGTLVDAFTHPTLHIDRLSPGTQGGQGDMLGKTSLQAWRATQSAWLLRSPVTIAGEAGPAIESQADSHFENPWPFAQAAIFGSRSARELARALTYTGILGEWNNTAWTEGRTGQPRAIMRGITNHGWAAWVFGTDTRIADRCDILRDHYIEPAKAQLGLPANRLIKTVNVLDPDPNAGPDRVDLRNWKQFRPWEDAHGITGMIGIGRMLQHQRDMTYFTLMARTTATDIFRYGSPRIVDASGRIVFTFFRPPANGGAPTVYEPAATAALADNLSLRQLTEAEMGDNNWSRCLMAIGNCQASNDGHMRLGVPGAGTGSFTTGVASYVADMDGAVGDVPLVRYVFDMHTGRFGNPNNIPLAEWLWLVSAMQWPLAMEYVWFASRSTSRGTISQQPSGCAMHSNGTDLWVILPGQSTVRRVTIATGAMQTLTPTLAANWTGVASQATSVALLDGSDPGFSRASYRVHVCGEQITGGSTVTFTLSDGVSRDVRAITYDPHTGGWLVGAWRANRSSVWRVPLGGGVATPETNLMMHEDMDAGIESISVLGDGRLIAYSNGPGRAWAHARATGGYWGPPRAQVDRGAWGCFTRHDREDDALRYVTIDGTGRILETEI